MAEGQRRRPRRGRAVENLTPALTILGSSCSIPRPARASSSYLVETGRTAIVLDFGTGAFANLVRFRTPESLDAILISHMHADHFIDLVALRYALRYGNRTHDRRVPLFLPPGGAHTLRAVVAPFSGELGAFLDDVFVVREYDVAAPLRLADTVVTFADTKHYIPCYAMRLSFGETTLVYSADTAPSDAVEEFARDANVILCEATLSEAEESQEPRGHISAREAGVLAKNAGAKSLLLSHYPASADCVQMKLAATAEFDGPVHVVDDADRYVFAQL